MATASKSLSYKTFIDQIRPFDARRDMATVADLIELCFADTLDQDGQRYIRQMRDYARNAGVINWVPIPPEWMGGPFIGYVCEIDRLIVGNISLISYRVGRNHNVLLANVAVHPDYRRIGIARSLTLQAIDHARRRNSTEIWLHVREDNQAAIALYHGLGFREITRRTSWISQRDAHKFDIQSDIQIRNRTSNDWEWQKKWLSENYPPEFSWNSTLKLNSLAPGWAGSLKRFFSNLFIQQWSAIQGDKLLCIVSLQSTSTYANALWLAAPGDCDHSALHALLSHARRQIPFRRPLMLDYPAKIHADTIQAAGFREHQTLIWMKSDLNIPDLARGK